MTQKYTPLKSGDFNVGEGFIPSCSLGFGFGLRGLDLRAGLNPAPTKPYQTEQTE